MTLKWLEGRLVDAEWDRATKNSSLPANGAYVVQPGPSKPHSSTSTTSCRYCKAAGHAITTCPQLEKKMPRQQLQQQHQLPYLPQSTYQPESQPYQPQQPQQMPFRSLSQSSPNKAAAHTALPPLAYPAHLAQPLLPSPTSDITSPALAASHLSSTPLSSSIDSRYADVAAAHLLPTSWLPSLPSLLLLISFLLCLFSILLQRPLASVLTSSPSCSSWLLDSGTSSHLCNDPHLFSSLRQPIPGSGVRFGGGEQYPAHGIGDILVYACHNNHTHPITLKDVLYIPQTVHNIISVRKLKDEGLTTHFPLHAPAQVFRGSTVLAVAHEHMKLFFVSLSPASSSQPATVSTASAPPPLDPASCSAASSLLWHRRFGHLNGHSLQQLHSKQMVSGISLNGQRPDVTHFCVFGCPVSVLLPTLYREYKLHDRSAHDIFLGHGLLDGYKSYRAYIPSIRRVVYSRDVTFFETSPSTPPHLPPPLPSPPIPAPVTLSLHPPSQPTSSPDPINPPPLPATHAKTSPSATPSAPLFPTLPTPPFQPFTLPTSLQKPASTPTSSPLLFPPLPTPTAQDLQLNFSDPSVNTILDEDRDSAHFLDDFAYIALHSHYEPPTITAARSCPAAPQWLAAADAEIIALLANRTYSVVPKPLDCTLLLCKWVFKVKENPHGSIKRY
ncbi:unnamed protein product [Closterium sp. NIES-65]|nr:unnamed protein product [Closterium sp. NIES-65]